MAFLTPCFVRVEDAAEYKSLAGWLQFVGWRLRGYSPNFKYIVADAFHGSVTFWNLCPEDVDKFKKAGFIFCGTSVELFKALAAINDTTDRDQWFVAKKNISDYYDIDDIVYQKGDMFFNESGEPLLDKHFRKATAEEIISYFKNKENE